MKYFRPQNLTEHFDYISSFDKSQYTILSGGTDLMPRYDGDLPLPVNLIDIKKIKELSGIVEKDNQIEIGALTTIKTLRRSEIIRKYLHALWLATQDFAGVQIRNRATIGGNICNASPAGDCLPPLYAFHAELKIISALSDRTVPIQKFILGPGKVDLRSGELLHSIIIPKLPFHSTFYKLGLRQAMAIAVLNYTIVYQLEKMIFSHLCIAAGAVAPTVVYLSHFTDALIKKSMPLEKTIELVDSDIVPISDIRASAGYRRKVLKNMLQYQIKLFLDTNSTNQSIDKD